MGSCVRCRRVRAMHRFVSTRFVTDGLRESGVEHMMSSVERSICFLIDLIVSYIVSKLCV